MADIFISYSSKDREKAEQLMELLSSAGLSVWIDKRGIGAATSWSKEIVDAIDECKALLLLLSPSSVTSINVSKELSLAAERGKKILPLDLEPVPLPNELAYHLAGLQRTPMTNIDSIIRAIEKIGLEATRPPSMKLVKETDGRKSLMVLPFEDLSPTGDNGWFADGLAAELIGALSSIKALKLIDWNTSRGFKEKNIQTTTLAREFNVRYFIEGQVRKFGDQIKISVTLLDIETGDHIWQDSLKGVMDDIFDIQEKVAEKVVAGLQLHLTSEEKKNLSARGTENPDAYECYIKGLGYFRRHTRSDYERALVLYEEAILLDPRYVQPHNGIALAAREMYRTYRRDPSWLDRAEAAAKVAYELEGESSMYLSQMSAILQQRGDLKGAVEFAKRSVALDPNNAGGYDALSNACDAVGDLVGAAQARKEEVRLRENHLGAHFNLLTSLDALIPLIKNEEELQAHKAELVLAAQKAISVFERYIRLNPDDAYARVMCANVYWFAGRIEDATRLANELYVVDALDGVACYNLACLIISLGYKERGLSMLHRALESGFVAIEAYRHDPNLDPLRGTPEFEELMRELEEKIAKK